MKQIVGEIWAPVSCCRASFFGPKATFDREVCNSLGWLNLVFLNNQHQNGGCFNISWSLAVQVHFYTLFPLGLILLRPKAPGFRWGIRPFLERRTVIP